MKFIVQTLTQDIARAFKSIYDYDCPLENISFQSTKKEFEGTHTFVVFPYTKALGKKPAEIAEQIGQYLLQSNSNLKAYNVVQGFLNLSFKTQVWLNELSKMVKNNNFGNLPWHGEKIMVEYSSPNTNKPLHLGHLRNNFLGYSVSKILQAAGYDVIKSNVVNDRGIHICKSMLAYQQFGRNETPQEAGVKGDRLVGDYYVKYDQVFKEQVQTQKASLKAQNPSLTDEQLNEKAAKEAPIFLQAQKMLQEWEKGNPEVIALWQKMNGWVYEGFEQTYKTIGVSFDKFYYESETYLLGKDLIKQGLENNIFFQKSDGSVWIDLSQDGLDEKLVLRADGTSVYITQDLGTADLKFEQFGMNKSVYVVGNEQDYHFQVLFLILKKLGRAYAEGLFHLSYGMVELPSGRMKSREGTVVDADDLVHEMRQVAAERTAELGKIEDFSESERQDLYGQLALGALKYYLLRVDPKKKMMFNPEESIDFQGNTGVYLQYTHAKICAIIRKAQQLNIQLLRAENIEQLATVEIELLSLLAQYQGTVKEAAQSYSPALIANYGYELARLYSRFYAELSIFGETDDDKRALRVAISYKVGQVLKHALSLLGIESPERM
ncbi:MAG: arginine--tRNA ligase [Cytophagales bacterium]|nr:MAG: arginine--tRNA ligase [Cytophagales bacterium]TAF61545.1 MAG: arginine--tRNA ligase [Cytophagales bacterium]